MNNKVKFLRGTATEYEAATKDNDTFYYTTDTKKLYLGETEITSIEIDDASTTATDKTWSAKKISEHSGNADIHVTAEDKVKWNAVNYSNPNLLINPDFRINQRGITSVTASGASTFFADHWYCSRANVTVEDGGGITAAWDGVNGKDGWIQEKIETTAIFGKTVTISADINGERCSVTTTVPTTVNKTIGEYADSEKNVMLAVSNMNGTMVSVVVFIFSTAPVALNNLKWELGSIATPFVPPDPATELAKCQHYYQIRSTNDIAAVDLRPSMATIKDIKLREDGNYEYIAEL